MRLNATAAAAALHASWHDYGAELLARGLDGLTDRERRCIADAMPVLERLVTVLTATAPSTAIRQAATGPA